LEVAGACVVGGSVQADAAVEAGSGRAEIDLDVAELACVARLAGASEAKAGLVGAGAAAAGLVWAEVVYDGAVGPEVAELALAEVLVDGAEAGAVVAARGRAADVDLDRAVLALEAWQTGAGVGGEGAATGGSVFAGLRQAKRKIRLGKEFRNRLVPNTLTNICNEQLSSKWILNRPLEANPDVLVYSKNFGNFFYLHFCFDHLQ
jgi:hypothetical protein